MGLLSTVLLSFCFSDSSLVIAQCGTKIYTKTSVDKLDGRIERKKSAVCGENNKNLKQNEAQSSPAESTHKGVN